MLSKIILWLSITLASTVPAWSQRPLPAHTDFYSSIGKYDVSRLWCADSLPDQGEGKNMAFPEPLGFIGDNFQRFYIHYTSVKKSKSNPYEYIVTGKTRVRDNICSFKGTIIIRKALLYKTSDLPPYREGNMTCDIHFDEDSANTTSGSFEGRLSTDFCLDKKGRLAYDAISIAGDGYSNNQSTTTWRSHRTGAVKKCNWGDFRIPQSGGLDVGAGAFVVDEKYVRNGWESYVKSYSSTDEEELKKALAEEDRKWWQ